MRQVWAFEVDPGAATRPGGIRMVAYALGSEAACEQARIMTAAQVATMMLFAPTTPPGTLGQCQPAWIAAGTGWWGFSAGWLGVLTPTEAGCREIRQQVRRNPAGHDPSACGPVSLNLGDRS